MSKLFNQEFLDSLSDRELFYLIEELKEFPEDKPGLDKVIKEFEKRHK